MKAVNQEGASSQVFLTRANLTLTFTVILCVLFFAPWSKPLWLDEGLHFSLGDMSLQEVLQAIDYTSIEINHGQTGVYMLVDWALMQVFGANLFFLRLPSFIAGTVLMWASVVFLRGRGMTWIWQFFGILAISSTPMFIYFLGEARPYMPLAAAAVCMFAYFSAPAAQRSSFSIRFIGFLGLVIGALFHPYWIYFFVLSVAFGYLVRWLDGSRPRGKKETFAYAGSWMTAVALTLFVLVGQMTWMRWIREFAYDPFEKIGGLGEFWTRLLVSHFYFGNILILLTLVVVAVLVLILRVGKPGLRIVFPAILLCLLALGSSMGISYLSFSRSYWIFERQWVGGALLSSIALVWLFGSIDKALRAENSWYWRLPSMIFLGLVVLAFFNSIQSHLQSQESWKVQLESFAADQRPISEVMVEFSDADMVYAANVNAVRGGVVWPIFTEWYLKQAGMRPEFREKNPSWTRYLFTN